MPLPINRILLFLSQNPSIPSSLAVVVVVSVCVCVGERVGGEGAGEGLIMISNLKAKSH